MSKSKTTFNLENTDHLNSKIFLDDSGPVGVARYETVKYPKIDKLVTKQNSFFWVPEEVDLSKDKRDFKDLSFSDEHIFTSNLFRQIALDTLQGRAPSLAFLPIVSNPETENFILVWSYFEVIHSRSYTHIIRNIYPDPKAKFDEVTSIPEIVSCIKSISRYYDELLEYNAEYFRTGVPTYEHKKAIWRALIAVSALEGIRFFLSFACSWNFGELKKMIGNANIIRMIASDEQLHLSFTQTLISILPKDDPDFAKIRAELEGESSKIIIDVVNQEKEWCSHLFQHGSMVGLNERVGNQYVEWLGSRRAISLGLPNPFRGNVTSNPLPWTANWLNDSNIQNANQENENTSYITGGLKPDETPINPKRDLDFSKLLKESIKV